MPSLSPQASLSFAIQDTERQFTPPVNMSRLWSRPNLQSQIERAFKNGQLYVYGSSGMGKTSLILGKLRDQKGILWAALRDCEDMTIARICHLLIGKTLSAEPQLAVVLDDLNPSDDPRNLELILGQLADSIARSNGTLVITSYKQPSPRLVSIFKLEKDSILNIPPLDEQEISEILFEENCPKEKLASFSQYLFLQTSGHPQFVAARLSYLKQNDFPLIPITDLVTQVADIKAVQTATLTELQTSLSDAARDLLYRLSMAIPPLRRSHILHLAGKEPAVARAGEVFEQLRGVWIEEPFSEHFRVSALVSRLGEMVLSGQDVKTIHSDIATVLLSEHSVTIDEFTNAILHALSGENESGIAIASEKYLTAAEENKTILAKHLRWITMVGTTPSKPLRIKNKATRQFFRLFQWDVARFVAHEDLVLLSIAMKEDFSDEGFELPDLLPRILYLIKILLEFNLPMIPNEIVETTLELWRVAKKVSALGAELPFARSDTMNAFAPDRPVLESLFSAVLLYRISRVEDLEQVIAVLEQLQDDDRTKLLNVFRSDDGELRLLMGKPWSSVGTIPESDSWKYVEVLRKSLSAGHRWGNTNWSRASARMLSAVLDEMHGERDEAEKVIDEAISQVGTSLNLEEQRAVIALNHNEYKRALSIWARVLPQWHADELYHDLQPVYGSRGAAISAAYLGMWDEAAKYFHECFVRASQFKTHCGWLALERTTQRHSGKAVTGSRR